jgi:ribosomal protein L11 methyltransferase
MESRAARWIDVSGFADPELASDLLFEAGAMGLEEPEGTTGVLRGWFAPDAQVDLSSKGLVVVGEGAVEARDWDLSWRLQQEPIRVTSRLVVVPAWVNAPDGYEFKLVMEAKQAFGTGGHESTRLAAQVLERLPLSGRSVFDLGAGTGILGFYARLLGAGHLDLCDIDPDAIPCLEENASVNGIDDWSAWAGSVDAKPEEPLWDVVFANMLRTEFEPLREATLARMRPGAHLVLSGYLVSERERMLDWFARAGLVLEIEETEGEWWAAAVRTPSR